MDTTPLNDLLDYWRTLPVAEGTKVPAKVALSPDALRSHLGNIGIFERIERYDLRVRLFGTRLDIGFGKSMTGANLFDTHAREQRDFYADYYASLLDTPVGCRMFREILDENDEVIHSVSLALPLADETGDVCYLVGMLLMESDSPLNDPIDTSRIDQAKVIRLEYLDIGHGLPANPPALPT